MTKQENNIRVGETEAANILLVAISSIVVLLTLDKAVNFDILDIQFKFINPPRAYFIVGAGFLLFELI